MNRDDGQTIAGRRLPAGYSLVVNQMTACLDLVGPSGLLVSFERSLCLSDIADEIVAACHQDQYRRMMEGGPATPMVSVDMEALRRDSDLEQGRLMEQLARRQREMIDSQILGAATGEANMGNTYQKKSPAALARLHREAARAGRVEGGRISGSFADLFKQLDENDMIPSRGERFGEPPITSGGEKIRFRKPSPAIRVKRTAKDECREIERMGAREWLLARHNDFVRDVRLP